MQLTDANLFQTKAYINGLWCGESVIDICNPADGRVIGQVPNMGRADTERAIEGATVAQKTWAQQTAKSRSLILRQWFELILENLDDLAIIITAEQGKPIKEARAEVQYAASFVEWFSEEAKRVYGDTMPAPQTDKRIVVMKQAVGVTAAITPWNFPAAMVTRKVAPALAAGCTMVLKPAPQTPFTALALAKLAEQAGVPAGVFNVVTGDAVAIGQALCANPMVRKLSFTGSTAVGIKLMEQCAPSIKKLSLELGGNAPFIVFADADIDAAVEGAIQAKFRNAGQTCVCANRLYVHSDVVDEFTRKLAKAMEKLRVGNGMNADVEIGPLVNDGAITKVEAHIQDALDKGAKLIMGGARHRLGGHYFEPSLLINMNSTMRIASEETFGPVAAVFTFDDVEQVIAQANDTEYGLAAYFYGRDISLIWHLAEALEYGMVGVNTGIISNEVAPFGGIKSSGIGREGSKYGLDEYLELKYVCLAI